jgi:hypothetical protein
MEVLHHPALAGPRDRERRHPPARLTARIRSPWLDSQLAAGVPPWRSPSHAARALQLTGDRDRRALARSLERLLEDAERIPTPFRGAAIRPCRGQVLGALAEIMAISALLRSAQPVYARGVAMLRAVLSDGSGPCYFRSDPAALSQALQEVSRWLRVAS